MAPAEIGVLILKQGQQQLTKKNIFIPQNEDYNDEIDRLYSKKGAKKCRMVTFQVTEDCCMACTYCYQNHKTKNKMSFDTIKQFLEDLLDDKNELINTSTTSGLIFDFIGGEPLLEINLINEICTYFLNELIKRNHPWTKFFKISMSSNGLLYFEKDVQEFFKKFGNFCSYGVSIDGNKKLHDMCRLDLNGKGTYDRAFAALKDYSQKYGKNTLSTKMTISPDNVSYVAESSIDMIKQGYKYVFINCIYEKGWELEHAIKLYE